MIEPKQLIFTFHCYFLELIWSLKDEICIKSIFIIDLTRAPLGGGLFRAPSRFLAISSKPMQVSPPNLQYPLSQQFYTLC